MANMKKPGGRPTKEQIKNLKPKGPSVKPAPMPKPKAKITAKPRPKPKAPGKKKIEMMPDKINPFKMTPAQKARYLKNPERYDY
jgi:hypothetical protein